MNPSHPYAIAMWDFSWLERRFPGGGYEDWDKALDELCRRGYDAVRIDAYPHLVSRDPEARWRLLPCWDQHDWGASTPCTVQVQPALNEFLSKCRQRGVRVGLSTWLRQDEENNDLRITSPRVLADLWDKTLQTIPDELRETILYIDLLNELPLKIYARFLDRSLDLRRSGPYLNGWMREAVEALHEAYPAIPMSFSSAMLPDWPQEDIGFMDFADLHLWMSSGEFFEIIDYRYENFDPAGYEKIKARAEALYRINPEYWQKNLRDKIEAVRDYSRKTGKPMICTECWALTNYKDMPGLGWEWVRELCEAGVQAACATGRYAAIATSNFCGPQFKGMWEDEEWHRRLTGLIRRSAMDEDVAGVFARE